MRPHGRGFTRVVDTGIERECFHCEWACLRTELGGPDVAEAKFDLVGFVREEGVESWVVPFVRAAEERQALLGWEHLVNCEEGGDNGGERRVGCFCCLGKCVYSCSCASIVNIQARATGRVYIPPFNPAASTSRRSVRVFVAFRACVVSLSASFIAASIEAWVSVSASTSTLRVVWYSTQSFETESRVVVTIHVTGQH